MFVCVVCGKTYKKEDAFKTHIINCNIQNKDEMTNKELTATVKYLFEYIKKQDRTIQSLKSWSTRQKKKCNIIDWLNTNYADIQTLDTFKKSLNLSNRELNNVFKKGFVDGICTLLENILMGDNIPIKCFDKDKYKFYVKKDTWVCDANEFNNFIGSICNTLMLLLTEWGKMNTQIILNDKRNDLYLSKLQLLVITGDEKRRKYASIQKRMYSFLKEDLKSQVEYEFVF